MGNILKYLKSAEKFGFNFFCETPIVDRIYEKLEI